MQVSQSTKENKLFAPDTAFFDLPIVRTTFGFACLTVVVSFTLIALFTESKASLDMEGFNGFIDMFKFPLGALAFFGGLFAFYATNHRSEQNKRSMELTLQSIEAAGEQNRFANYYKHLEELKKYLALIEAKYNDVSFDPKVSINSHSIHALIYPRARTMGIALNIDIKIEFRNLTLGVCDSQMQWAHESEYAEVAHTKFQDVNSLHSYKLYSLLKGYVAEELADIPPAAILYPDLGHSISIQQSFKKLLRQLHLYFQIISFDEKFDEEGSLSILIESMNNLNSAIARGKKPNDRSRHVYFSNVKKFRTIVGMETAVFATDKIGSLSVA